VNEKVDGKKIVEYKTYHQVFSSHIHQQIFFNIKEKNKNSRKKNYIQLKSMNETEYRDIDLSLYE
jgi:hypothetical protein